MAENKTMVSAVRFVETWDKASSVQDVANSLGISTGSASSRAAALRAQGVRLKKFPRGRANKLDVAALNALLEKRHKAA